MLLGALIDLGVPARVVREGVRGLGVDGIRMRVSRVKRGAVEARYVSFSGPARSSRERRYREIRKLLKRARLPAAVRERAETVFERLALAEARVHGLDPDEVHFHEVGAIDALGDIVGVSAAVEHLALDEISVSPVAAGHGQVKTAHGILPVPAPATIELLRGIPTYPAGIEWETVTPTGAALLAVLGRSFGPMPALVPEAQGFGAGDAREGPLPNVLRAVLGARAGRLAGDVITVLESNLDDMNPEHVPYVLERLLEAGALDVSLSPLLMKKGRPGHLLRVLCRPADRERLAAQTLLHSSAIGLRYYETPRLVLEREVRRVDTRFGRITVKWVTPPDGRRVVAPEYESCARAARRAGAPLREVYRAAERAAEDLGP